MVSRAKLIAEPWDVGQIDSYDLGRFPPVWREWNGKYRDGMRDFWRSHPVGISEFANRFCGSSDMYGRAGARPTASVNLITVHDGFTLPTWSPTTTSTTRPTARSTATAPVTTARGTAAPKGATDDPLVLALRARQSRAMLATLMLSFGIPMLLGGDELGRTQQGNNNAYCQDNQITWFDWAQADADMLAFTRQLIALRGLTRCSAAAGSWPAPRHRAALVHPGGHPDDRRRLGGPERAGRRALPGRLRRPRPGRRRHSLTDDDFLVLVNAWWEPLDFVLPAPGHRRDGRLRSTATTPGPRPDLNG